MIQIKNKVDCCGCTACANICPKQAITMKPDPEGFLYPVVNEEKATTTQGAENTESSADICFEAIKAEYDYCVTRAEKLENKVYILLAACAFVFVLLTTQIEKTGELGMPQSRSELLGIIIYVILLWMMDMNV